MRVCCSSSLSELAHSHTQLAPTPQDLAHLANGVYTLRCGGSTPSALNLPLASPTQFTASPTNWDRRPENDRQAVSERTWAGGTLSQAYRRPTSTIRPELHMRTGWS